MTLSPGRLPKRTYVGSLLLLLVAGAGCPTPDLTAKLLNELWVLLLHLLSELLAPERTGGVRLSGAGGPGAVTCPRVCRSRAQLTCPPPPPFRVHSCPPESPLSRFTHAWMRLARSFCEGLVPGVPRGLWPPEIIPDMLQGEPMACTPGWLPSVLPIR